jgi:hypothetical protein
MDTPSPETTENEPIISIETETVQEDRLTKEVAGENIQFNNGLAASVTAQNDLSVRDSLVFIARSEGNTEVQNSGAVAMVAGGNMQLTNGGAQVMVVGGNSELTNGGAQVMVVGGEMTAHKSFIGVAVTNQLNLSEDSKILLDKPQALLFGAAFGAVFALVRWLLRKKG